METRGANFPRIFAMSVFALSCVGLLLFLWVSFGGTLPLRAQGYRVAVLLPDSGDVTPQTDVRIAGVSVGKVVAVSLDQANTRAVLELGRQYAPLHGNVHVFVRRKSLLGEVYLELTPGIRTGPPLMDGTTIPPSHVTTTTSLDQILNAFDPSTRAALQTWLGGWAQSVSGRGPAISDDIARFAGTSQAANNLLGVLYTQRQALSTLISDTGTTFATIGDQNARVQQLITAGDTVFRTTAARNAELTATLHAVPPFLRALQATLAATQRLSVPGTPALNALQPAARLIPSTLRDALAVSPPLRSVAVALGPVLDVAPAGLADARAIVLGTVPLVPQLRFLGRYLVPIVDYLYAYRRELVQSWPKGAAATNGTLPDPGSGLSVHYLRAPAEVPSELVAIAGQRQPYSRPNAYMNPGGLGLFGSGKLEAFDCRQLANPLTVPPIPGGQPDCLQQQPWTFEGQTRQFPELVPKP